MDSPSHYNKTDFERIVTHHQAGIENAFNQALMQLNRYSPELQAEWNALSFAVVMHSHVCHSMLREFADVPGAKPGRKKTRAFILELDGAPLDIPEVVQLKCKQINPSLLTANITTDAVKSFNQLPSPERRHRQIQDTLHPSFGPPKTVDSFPPSHGNAGYIFNELKTGFKRLCITLITGLDSAELVLELSTSNKANGQQGELLNLPIGEMRQVATNKKRVKAKTTITQKPSKKRVKTETLESDTANETVLLKRKENG